MTDDWWRIKDDWLQWLTTIYWWSMTDYYEGWHLLMKMQGWYWLMTMTDENDWWLITDEQWLMTNDTDD